MKISASIYSNKNVPLNETIQDLVDHNVDMLHVDCNDDVKVFEDIKVIRELTNTKVDLHLITENLEPFIPLLRENPVDFLTIQYEDLNGAIELPTDIQGEKGIAVTSNTPIDIFEQFEKDFDYILIMATIPGQSGGVFNPDNFAKIRAFRKRFPNKKIHVDGGVNGEVSFILRNLGVYSSVSGSFLFNAKTIGSALMNLKLDEIDSHYQVKDFMRPLVESPHIAENDFSFKRALESIEEGKLGFTMVIDSDHQLKGITSNADIRKGLLRHLDQVSDISFDEIVNANPVTINEEHNVREMLSLIKSKSFPIMYLPVVNNEGKATGVVTFLNLIKGEL